MQAQSRIIALDNIRGLAITAMLAYHTLFDLQYFGLTSFTLPPMLDRILVTIFASLFISMAALTNSLSRRPLAMSLKLITFAAVISIATYLIMPQDFVYFGILHLLGALTLVAYTLRKSLSFTALLLLLVLALWFVNPLAFSVILGFPPPEFASIDYYPILPWSIPFIVGSIFHRQLLNFTRQSTFNRFWPIFSHLGRHSLIIYLLHQPIIFTLLWFYTKISP